MKTIYKIVNINSHKIYIGSSIHFKTRQTEHLSKLRCNNHHSPHLQNSYNKWGESSFKFEILEQFVEENILEKEQYYLDTLLRAREHNHFFTVNSYNIARIAGTNTKTRAVNKYTLEGEFVEMYYSLKEAGIINNITYQCIEKSCSTPGRTAVGYQWRYVDSSIPVTNILKLYASTDREGNIIEVYNSLQDIQDKTGLKTKSNIIRAINNNLTCMGYHWKVISRPIKTFLKLESPEVGNQLPSC